MRVLVACEFSGVVRDAFIKRGHDAMSCDLLPSDTPGPHYQGDVFDIIDSQFPEYWDMLLGFPPCTYVGRCGYHWCNSPDSPPGVLPLKGKPRLKAMADAAVFFRRLLNAPIKCISIENPRPICHAKLPPYTQKIEPWQFGHGETKATCLWLKNLPPLIPTNIVEGREQRIFKMPPGPNRSRERSRTYQGIADAMAAQWGNAA
jgi:hypothetical protein